MKKEENKRQRATMKINSPETRDYCTHQNEIGRFYSEFYQLDEAFSLVEHNADDWEWLLAKLLTRNKEILILLEMCF